MKIRERDERYRRAAHLDAGVERDERDREIRRVGSDAVLARAEHGVPAGLAPMAAHPDPGARLLHAA